MSPVRTTMRRTIGAARSSYAAAFSHAAFLAASAALFAFNLDLSEGGRASLASVWAVSVSPVLPFLAALLGMDVWSEERRSGRLDILLSTPVAERDFTLGKFLGVWTQCLAATGVFLAASLAFAGHAAPALVSNATLAGFAPAFAVLALQSALWSAAAVASSALFRSGAAAAVATCAVLVAAPRGVWAALSSWSGGGRPAFAEMPLDRHAFDFASGLVSTGTVVSYVALAAAALYAATKTIESARCAACASKGARAAKRISAVLALVLAALASALALRFDETLDVSFADSGGTRFSARTRSVLKSARGTVSVTAFLSRKDPRFRSVSHFLRALSRESEREGGITIRIRYVDPALDTGESQRLVRAGAPKESLVFERNGRIVDSIPLSGDCGERAVVSLVERIGLPFRKSAVYWTKGHGEASFSDYGPEGMSDIARDLSLDGYANKEADLASGETLPGDCALVIVAGPRTDFAAAEAERLKAYVEGRGSGGDGGRLLVLLDSADPGSLHSALSSLGIRVSPAPSGKTKTISGADVVADEFSADHPVTRPFAGQQVVLDAPVAVSASASAGSSGSGADIVRFTPILCSSGICFAAAAERGGAGPGAYAPSRTIAVGDAGFAMNGRLRTYANANRDFFLNAVKHLSGRDAITDCGVEPDRLVSGMDRAARARFAVRFAAIFPLSAFAILALLVFARRRR